MRIAVCSGCSWATGCLLWCAGKTMNGTLVGAHKEASMADRQTVGASLDGGLPDAFSVQRPVRGRFVLAEAVTDKAGEITLKWNVTVEIEGGERPALVAEWLGMQFTS